MVLLLVQLMVVMVVMGVVEVSLVFWLTTWQLLVVELLVLLVSLVKAPTSSRPPTLRWRWDYIERGRLCHSVRSSAPT